jgi:sigma-B regulation protein RsbU (phosphoserine phosphatase)
VFPPFPEVCDKMDIYASMEAAKDIGGDFYDFFRLDEEYIAFTIADVCGKGIPAALFMAVSRTTIRSQAALHHDPAECLTESNKMLVSYSVDCMFVTVFYGIYNTRTGLVTYSNAGHNRPYVVRSNGEVEMIPRMKGCALGLFVGKPYLENTLQLNAGDTLYMYTDGVNEAMDSSSEEFGNDRMADILKGTTAMDCRQVVDSMRKGIRDFVGDAEQSDDITMLVLKRK